MANPVILFRNYADSGVLSGGSYQLSLANAQDPDPRIVARSTNAQNSSTKFVADLGSQVTIGGVVVGPINSSPASTYRIRGYSNAGLTALVYDSGVKTVGGSSIDWSTPANWLEWENPGFWLGQPEDVSADQTPLYVVEVFPSNQVVQYWLVEFFDTANADGYVQFGRVLIARAWRPASPATADDNGLGFDFATDREETLGVLVNSWERGLRRSWRASFPAVEEAELFGDVFDLVIKSGLSKQVFVVPDPDDVANVRKRCFLAIMETAATLAQRGNENGSVTFDFQEVS